MTRAILECYIDTKQIYDNMMKDLDNGIEVDEVIQEMKEDAYLTIEEKLMQAAIAILEEQGNQKAVEALFKLHGTVNHDRAYELAVAILELNT